MSDDCYWDVEINLRNKKIKRRFYSHKTNNHIKSTMDLVRKSRVGDEFYFDGNNIIRHKVDIIGTYKMMRYKLNGQKDIIK